MIEVVAAIIMNNDHVLCVQRNEHKFDYISKKFEFPGGKIEKGETQTEALVRELKEELEIDAKVGKHFLTVEHKYPDFNLKMHAFIVNVESRNVHLTEHISEQWLTRGELYKVDWAAADIPIVDKLNSTSWESL